MEELICFWCNGKMVLNSFWGVSNPRYHLACDTCGHRTPNTGNDPDRVINLYRGLYAKIKQPTTEEAPNEGHA